MAFREKWSWEDDNWRKMLLRFEVKPTSGFIKIFNDIHLEDASKRI